MIDTRIETRQRDWLAIENILQSEPREHILEQELKKEVYEIERILGNQVLSETEKIELVKIGIGQGTF